MIKPLVIAASGVLAGSAAWAGPYANVEMNGGYQDEYLGSTTDVHIGYEGTSGPYAFYLQGGPAIVAPDGEDSEIELSGKIGASVQTSDQPVAACSAALSKGPGSKAPADRWGQQQAQLWLVAPPAADTSGVHRAGAQHRQRKRQDPSQRGLAPNRLPAERTAPQRAQAAGHQVCGPTAHRSRPRAEATAAAVQTNRCCGSPAKNAQRCAAPNLDRPWPAAPAAPAQAPAEYQQSWNPAACQLSLRRHGDQRS